MRQCPDCEEKDRVVIAGKVFCANCGAPWEPVNQAEKEPYLQKVGVSQAPPPPAEPTKVETEQADPVAAALAAATGSVPATTPPAPTAAMAPSTPTTAPPAPVVPPAPAPVSAPVMNQSSTVPAPPPAASASAPSPVSLPTSTPAAVTVPLGSTVASAPVPPADGVSTTQASTQVQSAPMPTVSNPEPITASTPQPSSPPLESLKEDVGSEIPTLDSKEDPVLSDGQFTELAQVKVSPTPSASAPSPRPMNDVVIPTAAQSAVSAPTPAPITTQTTASRAVPPANMTTVAGVTMSHEDALKLALGDEVGSAVAKPADKKGPAKPAAVVMTVIALVLLGAYLWQVNYPNFALRLAAMRSGMNSSAPGYLPTGWSQPKEVKMADGSLSYSVEKGDKKLTITEKKTTWDSQAVLEQYVLKNTTDYTALQAAGLTIYVFGNNQAAWVNHGSFYTLTGDHGIDQDDIIKVATSL